MKIDLPRNINADEWLSYFKDLLHKENQPKLCDLNITEAVANEDDMYNSPITVDKIRN